MTADPKPTTHPVKQLGDGRRRPANDMKRHPHMVRPASPGAIIAKRIADSGLTLEEVSQRAQKKEPCLRQSKQAKKFTARHIRKLIDGKKVKWIDIYLLAYALGIEPNGILLAELMRARWAVRDWDEEELADQWGS